ncbi:MAG: MoaD/ThiS family protein [Verrucomicrobia bacterium]|nr:MoaD/ThiS family protein [Verrucomicrobiota bacterium]
MNLSVSYYAMLREQRGLSNEAVETDAATAGDLYVELAREHGLTLKQEHMRVSINNRMVNWDEQPNDGDTVAFLPPMSGG